MELLLSRSVLAASLEMRVRVREPNRDWDGNWDRRSSCSTPPSQVNTTGPPESRCLLVNGVVIDEGNGTVGLLSRSIEKKLHLVI